MSAGAFWHKQPRCSYVYLASTAKEGRRNNPCPYGSGGSAGNIAFAVKTEAAVWGCMNLPCPHSRGGAWGATIRFIGRFSLLSSGAGPSALFRVNNKVA